MVGVDFSGAAVSGKTAWLAGNARPDAASRYLVDRFFPSQQTAWEMDFRATSQLTIVMDLKVASTVDRWPALQQVAMLVIPLTA